MAASGSMLKDRKAVFNISSSDEESDSWVGQAEEEDDDDEGEGEGEEEDSESEDEDYEDEESESYQDLCTDSEHSSDEDEEYESVSEDQSDEGDDNNARDPEEGKPTDDKLIDKVTYLLRQRNKKLDALKLEECKAYLRKHELMISGTKVACIQRILEHWRLKDGNGDRLYPKSTFTINCTGDVCKGDVVMFKQRVYEKFDKMSRSGKILGKRTIVGRVVKESYGVAKQQHTFTVEVLWSKGVKPLPLLYPLLVKGRNLYRFRTFRQVWHNETERCRVLEEKHRRGATARYTRASNHTRNYVGSKRRKKPIDLTKQPSKRLKKYSEAAPRKKQKQTSNSKTRIINLSSKKHTATASSSRHAKKGGTNASSVSKSKKSKTQTSSYTHRRQVNHCRNEVDAHHISAPSPTPGPIYNDPYTRSHQRNNITVGSQTGRESSHIPSYNYDHNAGRVFPLMREQHRHHHQRMNEGANYFTRPYFVHTSQYDRRGHFGNPHSTPFPQYGSGSSGHSFTPAAYDYKFSSFQFHRGWETYQ